MSENNEPDARNRHISTPNPAVEGESGQYVAGDYGDAGDVDAVPAAEGSGGYADAEGGIGAGHPNDFTEDQDAVPGRPDDATDGGARRD